MTEEAKDGAPKAAPSSPGRFVAVDRGIRYGSGNIAFAISRTMAKRIANALNSYTPNKKGY
jgi:hypothetical protein